MAQGGESSLLNFAMYRRALSARVCGLTNRWSGRVEDKVPSSNVRARAAQLNR
jgi:hypothetical protein